MDGTVVMRRNGDRRDIFLKGSLVYFFENDHQQFSNRPRQGFIEDLDPPSQEVTLRTVEGKILTNVSLHRVYL